MWYVTGMPTETETTVAPDPRDAEIALLKSQVADLRKELDSAEADNEALAKNSEAKIADLKRKLAAKVPEAPKGNFAVLDGTTYPIIGDFRAGNTFEEVKKGNCPEGVTLLAIDKAH